MRRDQLGKVVFILVAWSVIVTGCVVELVYEKLKRD